MIRPRASWYVKSLSVLFISLGLVLAFASNSSKPSTVSLANPIVEENKQSGVAIPQTQTQVNAQAALAFTQPAINGYASASSINKGESIKLYVSTTASNYDIEVYRVGWYGGAGSSLKQTVNDLPGQFQPTPAPDPVTGLIDAGWQESYNLQTNTTWVTGVYLAKLVPSSGASTYIIFVIRDDGAPADILFQLPVTTYQAYNNWGGKSLYDYNSEGGPARKVSYNRPYGSQEGTGDFFNGDYNMIRFLESQGYSISYATSEDVHTTPGLLANRKVFLSNRHDEYWSKPMRDNLTAWRDQGKDLAFFDANNIYWQVRFENDLAGNPNRTMVCYKPSGAAADADPMESTNPELTTTQWRKSPVNKPENELLGGMYEAAFDYDLEPYPWIVQNSSHWVYSGTGVKDGDSIPGVVGYEYDKVWNNGLTPANLTVLSNSPVNSPDVGSSFANGTIYTAASGAIVFNAGTIDWSWKLDDNTHESHGADGRIQKMTKNILNAMIGGLPPVSEPSLCPCSIFNGSTPQGSPSTDSRAVEVGVKFKSQTKGAIKSIKFYKGSGNTGTHVGSLWSASGDLLGRATFSGESATGWQKVDFQTPIPIEANTTYVASYFAPNGRYSYNQNYFATAAIAKGPLTALKNSTSDPNGVYKYATSSTFPNATYASANYWVDVVFEATGYGLWTSSTQTPSNTGAGTASVELGMKFKPAAPGLVKGVRFYKGAGNTGTHTGALWAENGTKLKEVTFTAESASGWQTAYFSSPQSVAAGSTYVVSYHSPAGKYSYNQNFFLNSAIINGNLTALKNGTNGGNGVYKYGSGVIFPNQTYNSSNYWVDVLYSAAP